MTRSVIGATRFLASAVALALAVVSSLTCFIGAAQMTAGIPQVAAPRHACCGDMTEGCSTTAAASVQPDDCCTTQAPSTAALSPDRSLPPLAVVAIVVVVPPPAAILRDSRTFDVDVLASSSPPTYLLDSVFRI
jgi:hypothetical protein